MGLTPLLRTNAATNTSPMDARNMTDATIRTGLNICKIHVSKEPRNLQGPNVSHRITYKFELFEELTDNAEEREQRYCMCTRKLHTPMRKPVPTSDTIVPKI